MLYVNSSVRDVRFRLISLFLGGSGEHLFEVLRHLSSCPSGVDIFSPFSPLTMWALLNFFQSQSFVSPCNPFYLFIGFSILFSDSCPLLSSSDAWFNGDFIWFLSCIFFQVSSVTHSFLVFGFLPRVSLVFCFILPLRKIRTGHIPW